MTERQRFRKDVSDCNSPLNVVYITQVVDLILAWE